MRASGQAMGRSFGVLAFLLITACSSSELDWDLRSSGLDTTGAVSASADARPAPDSRGIISYPTYQVVVAKQGDTVTTVADRIGLPAQELASYNALSPGQALRAGEVLVLPRPAPAAGAATDVAAIASTALDRVQGAATAAPPAPTGDDEPLRHTVRRGETAFTIARTYNVSAKALADWNGLGPDLAVREGQVLIIPTGAGTDAPAEEAPADEAAPGAGSATPEPPSASEPLPDEETLPAAEAEAKAAEAAPTSPALDDNRSAESAAQFAMPAEGKIIRPYSKGKNDGIDIAAPAGTPVRAAADGTVAAITADTSGTPIIVLRHDGGVLTVYAGVDGVTVKKGDAVTRGQTIAKIKAGDPAFLHFEVRLGADSADPMGYLQ